MGKRGGAVRRSFERLMSSCMQRPKNQNSQNLILVPKIPSWEKEFILKVGLFKWKDFLEAKKGTRFCTRILEWNDVAAEEAFYRSKKSFLANESCSMSPDLYIDDVDWEGEDEASLAIYDGLESGKLRERKQQREEDRKAYVPDSGNVRIKDVMACLYEGLRDLL